MTFTARSKLCEKRPLDSNFTIALKIVTTIDFLTQVGDHIAVVRKTAGDLHFFINGRDQGLAASNVEGTIYGVVDLYGMAVQVSIKP